MKKRSVSPAECCIYEFELIKDESLNGVISSTSSIDVYLVDSANFSKWMISNTFDFECCNESVLVAKIDYLAPREGTWYLLIENNGKEKAKVEVRLDVSN